MAEADAGHQEPEPGIVQGAGTAAGQDQEDHEDGGRGRHDIRRGSFSICYICFFFLDSVFAHSCYFFLNSS